MGVREIDKVCEVESSSEMECELRDSDSEKVMDAEASAEIDMVKERELDLVGSIDGEYESESVSSDMVRSGEFDSEYVKTDLVRFLLNVSVSKV